jgi:hypothetical protein
MAVTKKNLDLACMTIKDYYNMIIQSKIDGNSGQCAEQFKALSRDQRKECLIYMAGDLYTGGDSRSMFEVHDAMTICIESIY